MCGCGLGGVAASVGIFGAVAVNELTKAATVSAFEFATEEGIKAGIQAAIAKIKGTSAFLQLKNVPWSNFIDGSNYNTIPSLVNAVTNAINSTGKTCNDYGTSMDQACSAIGTNVNAWLGPVAQAAKDTTASITESIKTGKLGEVATTSSNLYSAIGYSVLAILIIVLVMIIIYLVLRYRRKKKMNIKSQYKKLLNQ
ncbi:rifin, partial [Plasmodium reichenowi]